MLCHCKLYRTIDLRYRASATNLLPKHWMRILVPEALPSSESYNNWLHFYKRYRECCDDSTDEHWAMYSECIICRVHKIGKENLLFQFKHLHIAQFPLQTF